MQKNKITYTGAFRFPDNDAAGKRAKIIADMLSKNYNLTIINWGSESDSDKFEYKVLNSHDLVFSSNRNFIEKIKDYVFLGFKSIKNFKSEFTTSDLVILYNPPSLYCLMMLFLSKLYKFKIILDITEWYDSTHLPGGRYSLPSLENGLRMRVIYRLFKYRWTISTFLDDYYSKFGMSYKFPPVSDEFKVKNKINDDSLHLMYAGSPGKKDRVDDILLFSKKLSNECNVRLSVFGMTEEEFKGIYPDTQIDSNVNFFGRVSMDVIYNYYSCVDFVVFFREDKRYAWAGFPSKFVEAISFDTPVITNDVGDISTYIGNVGYLYSGSEEVITSQEVKELERLKSDIYSRKKLWSDSFDIKCHSNKLNNFIRGMLDDSF